VSISESLGLSKLYLEQILSVLKSHQIVVSTKGPSGGYSIKTDSFLNAFDVLSVLEPSLAPQEAEEKTHKTLGLILDEQVYQPLNQAVESSLKAIKLDDLSAMLNEEPMYYI
jgi:DNA-binding IscR family transcriptional regulator